MGFKENGGEQGPRLPDALLETCDDETRFQLWISGMGDSKESVISLTRAQWEHIASVLRKW